MCLSLPVQKMTTVVMRRPVDGPWVEEPRVIMSEGSHVVFLSKT